MSKPSPRSNVPKNNEVVGGEFSWFRRSEAVRASRVPRIQNAKIDPGGSIQPAKVRRSPGRCLTAGLEERLTE